MFRDLFVARQVLPNEVFERDSRFGFLSAKPIT
jgi:hypothetical protein